MILRRVVAKSMAGALARVEREVGRDALIVGTSRTAGSATVFVRAPDRAPPGVELDARAPSAHLRAFPPGFRAIAERLDAFGISRRLVEVLHRTVRGITPHILEAGDPTLRPTVLRVLAGLCRVGCAKATAERVRALVGPTGVGKTTTLAKLAAHARYDEGLAVGIVTIDTFRIAAVEQLRAFADMMELPFRVAFTPLELRRAVRELGSVDRIYVDTAGRSPRDARSIGGMKGYLSGLHAEVGLCLPAPGRRGDLQAALAAWRCLGPSNLVITKWDETDAPGEALSLGIEHDIRLSWITHGQRVPEDIRRADAKAIAASALGVEAEAAA